jgi:hypothetical protein
VGTRSGGVWLRECYVGFADPRLKVKREPATAQSSNSCDGCDGLSGSERGGGQPSHPSRAKERPHRSRASPSSMLQNPTRGGDRR